MAIRKLLAICLSALILTSTVTAKSKKKTKGFNSSTAATAEADSTTTEGNTTEGSASANTASADTDADSDSEEEGSVDAEWQYLEWEEEDPEYVLKYEIIIEERNAKTGEYAEINRLYTETNVTNVKIQPLLPPGFYRFKILTYNLIGIPEVESDWQDFTIYQAYLPQVRGVENASSLSSTIYLDEVNDGILNINGRNLFTLQESPDDISFTSYSLVNSKRKNAQPIIPNILEFSDNNRKLKTQINMDEIDAGVYNFIATDASGLTNAINKDSQLTVKFRKAVDLDISAGYTCPVFVIGDRLKNYLNTPVLPLSGTAKITFIPVKRRFGYFGIAAEATYSRLMTKTDGYDLDGNYITGHGMFVYQLPIRVLNKKTQKLRHVASLEVHGGAGVAMFQNTVFHFSRNIKSTPLNSMDISAIAGASVQWYPFSHLNRLYFEIGADFVVPFIENMFTGYVEPKACIGWQF